MSLEKNKIRIWHLSDTHGYHSKIVIPEDIDLVIHSGDAGNYRDPYINDPEIRDFANWYAALPIMYKIYVAGNHDSAVENLLWTKEIFDKLGINYLFNDSIDIMGLQIWGSPHTPQFGNWSFMKNRSKIGKVWNSIPEDTDIVVTHGPAKGILDTTINRDHSIEHVGDSALNKRILKLKPRLFCFGHIHDVDYIHNAGVFKKAGFDTIYSNGACMTDAKFKYGPSSNGNVFEVDLVTKQFTIR